MSESKLIDCPECGGTGKVQCGCPDCYCQRVEGHPLNATFRESTYSREGYTIKLCKKCGKVWGHRWQWSDGTGSDDVFHDYGFVDPMTVTEMK